MKLQNKKNLPALLCAALLLAGCASTTRTTQTSFQQRQASSHQSAEKSRRDSLFIQSRSLNAVSTQTLLMLSEPLSANRTQVAIPLRDLANLPQGASYSSRNGRVEIKAEKRGDTLLITGGSDSIARRSLRFESRTNLREQTKDSLSTHHAEASTARDSTRLNEQAAATVEKHSDGGLLKWFIPGLLAGALLTLLLCRTDLVQVSWEALKRIF